MVSNNECDGTWDYRPRNIVVIQVDDLAWHHLGCQNPNSFYETPNLDNLAQRGWRFSQAYSAAPICSASRAGLMTGVSPAKLGLEFVTKPSRASFPTHTKLIQPSYPQELPFSTPTLGDYLSKAGYSTGFVGKWHLTQNGSSYLAYGDENGPEQRGFTWSQGQFGAHPYAYSDRDLKEYEPGMFPVDDSSKSAVQFIRDNSSRPFYLHFSSYFPHVPLHTPCKWLFEKYQSKNSSLTKEQIFYAAMVESMDYYIGHIFQELEYQNLSSETMIIFTSDHGGDPRHDTNCPHRGSKWTLYEGGIRVPFMISWPEVLKPEIICNDPIGGIDLMSTLCDLVNLVPPKGQDGTSLLPLLGGTDEIDRSTPLFWHFPFYHPSTGYQGTTPCSAIRVQNWKLIHFFEDQRSELYNLEVDVMECEDLSRRESKVSIDLEGQLLSILQRRGARLPRHNPEYLSF